MVLMLTVLWRSFIANFLVDFVYFCCLLILISDSNNKLIIITRAILMVLSEPLESSPGSFNECRLSAGWPPTLRPSQPTWAVSPLVIGSYYQHSSSPFIIVTLPESWYLLYRPTEGRRLSRPRKDAAARAHDCVSQWLSRWTNWQRSLTPQPGMPIDLY